MNRLPQKCKREGNAALARCSFRAFLSFQDARQENGTK
jgi:hypothetical protein